MSWIGALMNCIPRTRCPLVVFRGSTCSLSAGPRFGAPGWPAVVCGLLRDESGELSRHDRPRPLGPGRPLVAKLGGGPGRRIHVESEDAIRVWCGRAWRVLFTAALNRRRRCTGEQRPDPKAEVRDRFKAVRREGPIAAVELAVRSQADGLLDQRVTAGETDRSAADLSLDGDDLDPDWSAERS